MRIRNAAVAGATALAVAFAGVANAEEPAKTENTTKVANIDNPKSEFYIAPGDRINNDRKIKLEVTGNSMGSSKIGDKLDKNVYTNGNNIFGDKQDPNLPAWAKLFYASGILGAVGTVIGTIIAAVNYGLHEGLIKF
ncbi:hypothetical protein [Corynebacterium pyruviciproducens]|uniref:hypothetical protein n=1 Tax=Corynebacterium pyruviciproducens TaxID=598660 RepID=UPI0023F1ED46|nr:hypothetical protein [Corynebacterium pyruviciproducens]MDK7214242.1 hypothetical protein [Corynebacterium pyruviciproducens]